jgi:small neutral amino acid transporter SnatA (MarC family)
MPVKMQVFTLLFLLPGPFKKIGLFSKITQGADQKLIRQIAIRAMTFSSVALLLASLLGRR